MKTWFSKAIALAVAMPWLSAFAGVYDGTPPLPENKVDTKPLGVPHTQAVTAVEFNNLKQGASDLRADAQTGKTYDVRTAGAKCDGTTDDTAAFNAVAAAIISSGAATNTVFIPPGTCKLTSQTTWTADRIHIRGAGQGATKIDFEPTADGVAFYFGNPSDHGTDSSHGPKQYFWDSIEGIEFFSNDTAHQKTMVFLHSVANFRAENIMSAQGTWHTAMGANKPSVGINVQTVQAGATRIIRPDIYADRPIWLSADTLSTVTNLNDDCHITDSLLVGFSDTVSTNPALIYVDDMFVQSFLISGSNVWIMQKYGFYWNAPTQAVNPQLTLRMQNIRAEQTQTAGGEVVHINLGGAIPAYGLQFENIQFDAMANGLYVHGAQIQDVLLHHVARMGGASFGSPTPFTADIAAQLAILENVRTPVSNDVNMNGMTLCFGTAATPDTTSHSWEVWSGTTFTSGGQPVLKFPGGNYLNAAGTYKGNLSVSQDVVAGTDSANSVVLAGAGTGSAVSLSAQGSDTNVNLLLQGQAAGVVQTSGEFDVGGHLAVTGTSQLTGNTVITGTEQVGGAVALGVNSTNSLTFTGASTGNPFIIGCQGDSNCSTSIQVGSGGVLYLNNDQTMTVDNHGKVTQETGAQTCSAGVATNSKVSGTIVIPSGTSSCVVTDSRISTSSSILPWIVTPGKGVGGATAVNNTNGTFTITTTNGTGAATNTTADCTVGFRVQN